MITSMEHPNAACEHEPKWAKGLCRPCYAHAWHAAHPDYSRQQAKNWRDTHPLYNKECNQKWILANFDIHRAHVHKRRARKIGNGGSWTATEWQTLKRQYGNRCVSCWKTEIELKALDRKLVPDHIVPLAKGGLDHITNLQPLCHGRGGCNNKKKDKFIDFVIS